MVLHALMMANAVHAAWCKCLRINDMMMQMQWCMHCV